MLWLPRVARMMVRLRRRACYAGQVGMRVLSDNRSAFLRSRALPWADPPRVTWPWSYYFADRWAIRLIERGCGYGAFGATRASFLVA